MARSSTTFKKRQKELARQEKAREKTERRGQRKVEKEARGTQSLDDAIDYNATVYDFIPAEYHPEEPAPKENE